jgi:ribosomal protein S18 acetylase RimI-like enzyme
MITIRRAVAGDIDDFKNVVVESVLESCKGHYTSAQLASLLAQYPGREVYEKWLDERLLLVAEDEGKIVGFAQYFPPDSSLEAVHVLPSYGKQGIGKTLVTRVEEIASTQGARKIILGASANAVGFYEKCGYARKEKSTFKCNDGNELDVVNFEKERIG